MAIEKLQETVANLVNGPFGTLIDKMAILVGQAGTLKFILGGIVAIMGVKLIAGLYNLGGGIIKATGLFASLAAEATFINAMLTAGLGLAAGYAAYKIAESTINSISGGAANISGAGGSVGVNVPNSGVREDKNISITLKNENINYVGGQKISHISTEQQKQINTRTA